MAGLQLAAVVQSPLDGLLFHVALPASLVFAAMKWNVEINAASNMYLMVLGCAFIV